MMMEITDRIKTTVGLVQVEDNGALAEIDDNEPISLD
jgi:hypothetical protein